MQLERDEVRQLVVALNAAIRRRNWRQVQYLAAELIKRRGRFEEYCFRAYAALRLDMPGIATESARMALKLRPDNATASRILHEAEQALAPRSGPASGRAVERHEELPPLPPGQRYSIRPSQNGHEEGDAWGVLGPDGRILRRVSTLQVARALIRRAEVQPPTTPDGGARESRSRTGGRFTGGAQNPSLTPADIAASWEKMQYRQDTLQRPYIRRGKPRRVRRDWDDKD